MRNLLSSGTTVCFEFNLAMYWKLMFGVFKSRWPYFKLKIAKFMKCNKGFVSFENVFHIQFLNLILLCHVALLLSVKITMILGVCSEYKHKSLTDY